MSNFIKDIFGGITGGGGGGGSNPFTPYSPTGLANADKLWQNIVGSMPAMINQSPLSPMASFLPTLYNEMIGNVNNAAPGMQTAAQNAANYYNNMASQADAFHNIMTNQANQNFMNEAGLLGAGNQAYLTSLDPQQQLYDATAQKVQEQARAANAASGLSMSPVGTGIENEDMTNFNIDWQNQQLQRQLSGLQGMGTAYTQAGQQGQAADAGLTGAQAMSGLAPQLLMQGASLPYTTVAGLLGDQLNAMNQTGNTFQSEILSPWAGIAGMTIPYMNYGSGAQANAFGAGQTNFSNLASGIGSLFGGGGGGGLFGQAANAGAGGAGSGFMGALSSLFGNAFSDSAAFGDFLLSLGGGTI